MNDNQSPEASTPPPADGPGVVATESAEKEIDLNNLFPDEETDLNSLFPDEDIKRLLKSISKNKKDLHSIKDRIVDENSQVNLDEKVIEDEEDEPDA